MPAPAGCAAMPVSDPKAGSWAREMTDTYSSDDDGAPEDPDWGRQNTMSKRAVVLGCGCFGIGPAAGEGHLHDPVELAAAQKLAGELGEILKDVYVHMGDESDHYLKPFFAAVLLAGPPAPGCGQGPAAGSDGPAGAEAGEPPEQAEAAPAAVRIDEELLRGFAFGGALDPRYPLAVKPLPAPAAGGPLGGPGAGTGDAASGPAGSGAIEAAWLRFRREILKVDDSDLEAEPWWREDGPGAKELAKWRAAFEWLHTNPALVPGSPCLISMHEPRFVPPQPAPRPDAVEEDKRAYYRALSAARPMGCIFPRVFAALTHGGSLVGVAAVVVHT